MSPLNFNPSNDGYWGDTASTLDWCETNYEEGQVLPCVLLCLISSISQTRKKVSTFLVS